MQGADVFLCARNGKLLAQEVEKLRRKATPSQKIGACEADVSKTADVERLFSLALRELPTFSGLVNNAGIYGPKGPSEEVAWDEWAKTIEINLLGTVYPCRVAVTEMKKLGRKGKIVNLSGGGATAPLPFISAYAASKAAVVRYTETIAEELRDFGIEVNALAPGALNTRLLDEVIAAGPRTVGAKFHEKALKQKAEGGAPLDVGARCAAYLLSSRSDGVTGKLISAMWDPWEELESHLHELKSTDIYTLRRIVPKERGMGWGDK